MNNISLAAILCVLLQSMARGEFVPSKTRVFFIAAVEEDWDYAPSGRNLISNYDPGVFLNQSWNRIGHIYKKAIYRQYTDDTYHTEIPKPAHIGILGPILRAEVGERIVVKFKNLASFPYTAHPHGAQYEKGHEGAFYMDSSQGKDTDDDYVPPGHRFDYEWDVTTNMAPANGDPNCIPYLYHSHLNTPIETNSGLMGPLIVCKKGTLNDHGERRDVDKDVPILLKIFDENSSHYILDNTKRCGHPTKCAGLANTEDLAFSRSNRMHAINGYVYGNMPPVEMCEGGNIAIYVYGMGSEADVHTLNFHGQTLIAEHQSTAAVVVFSAIFVAASMKPVNPGRWVMSCGVLNHIDAGMEAFFDVKQCGHNYKDAPYSLHHTPDSHPARYFNLGIDFVEWDYGPSGRNKLDGSSLSRGVGVSTFFFKRTKDRIGGVYNKVKFTEYHDESFTSKEDAPDHMGILGPVIAGEVGETIEVTIKNNADRNYAFSVDGVEYDIRYTAPGYFVAPGQTKTYILTIPDTMMTSEDPDCVVRIYQSDMDPVRDTNSGLIGPMLICKKHKLVFGNQQIGVNEQFFLLFNTFDENLSWYLGDNINSKCGDPSSVNLTDPHFVGSNVMSAINGRMYGNLDGLDMCIADTVAWHMFASGSETDVHTAYFHGQSFTSRHTRGDTELLIPGKTSNLLMEPDNPGTWMLSDHTNVYFENGVSALFTVRTCGRDMPAREPDVAVRKYYIQAEEMEWNYSPRRRSILTGADLDDPKQDGNIFIRDDNMFIGSTYKKVVFREYTDATFKQRKHRTSDNIHLGINGPMIKAEVGDMIEIMFRNNASRSYTMQPHGVFYDKSNEGSTYDDGVFFIDKQGVAPGQLKIYKWKVNDRVGPADNDPNCIPWIYYSGLDHVKDPYSGLFGPLIICRHGTLDHSGKRKDVDREFVTTFSVLDENSSWYLGENIENHAHSRIGTNYAADPDFEESNLMHSINGFVNGNNKGLTMVDGENVAWYILGIGTEIDIHTVHFHGHSFIQKYRLKFRNDVTTVFPGGALAVSMKVDNPGKFLLHCHVNDHIIAGMETLYEILPKDHRHVNRDQSG